LIGQLKDLSKYDDDAIWTGIQKKNAGSATDQENPDDLKSPEWRVFSNPSNAIPSRNFKLRTVDPPTDYASYFEKIVLVEKLREVRALVGFTRIMSPRDFDSAADLPPENRAKISRTAATWLPASETRGEGIFFQFSEKKLQDWVVQHKEYDREFELANQAWRAGKRLEPNKGYPGIRYVLLHTFAHALIRQLAIECGYTSASITERIYSRNPDDGDPMAGVLIYTAASDSEGTLGGLCALGEPDKLGRHIRRALEKMSLCASDPLCSEHAVGSNDTLHGASCHACSFLPETSCERGNKYEQAIVESAYALACSLPNSSVESVAAAIIACSDGTLRAEISRRIPHYHHRDLVLRFLDEWRLNSPEVDPRTVAVALKTAALSLQRHRDSQSVELVWTGPDVQGEPFRRTEQAILQLLDAARERITLVSFAVYSIPNIARALVSAATRGVQLTVIIETPDKLKGENEYSTLRALGKEVADCSTVYYWPTEIRQLSESGKPGILHVKCAVADDEWMFLSSANLTQQAFTINMELGVLVRGGSMPRSVQKQFDLLIKSGRLKELER